MNEDPEAVSTLHVPNPGRPVGRARHDEPLFHLDTEHPLPVAGEGVNSSVKPERSKLKELDGSISCPGGNLVGQHIQAENCLLVAIQDMAEFLGII